MRRTFLVLCAFLGLCAAEAQAKAIAELDPRYVSMFIENRNLEVSVKWVIAVALPVRSTYMPMVSDIKPQTQKHLELYVEDSCFYRFTFVFADGRRFTSESVNVCKHPLYWVSSGH